MPASIETSVLVVGAGPVGLTLAMDLAWRGIDVTVVEMRHRGEPPNVKCNHTSARSMEIFRRLGVAQKLRNAGLPADYPNDCSYRTTVTGIELARIQIPARAERYTNKTGPDGWWPTAEPPHRINQIFLEPVLTDHAVGMKHLTLINRTQLDSFTQDDNGVTALAHNLDNGEALTIRAQYMIGCDGGSSRVRKAIGASLSGTPVVQRVQSSYIRAPKLKEMLPGKPAWVMFSLNPRRCGNTMAIDGRETWLIHNYLLEGEEDFDAIDRDWAIRTILGVGPDFQYEVLSKEDWVGRRLVADKFRDRRVFICGDSAHLWVPYAGYGMNAGIADAANLSWLLAARIKGWGSDDLLDAYERERLPITEQVSHFAMNHAKQLMKQYRVIDPAVEQPGPAGDAARAELGQAAYDLNVQQYCCGGLNFGYYYAGSPIVKYDGEAPPPYTMYDFTPSTVPGCRTPHFWLANGRSLYDALGPDYTLLRFDRDVDVGPLLAAAASRGVPLQLLDIRPDEAPKLYRHKLLLSRPDQHVAWRGDAVPADPLALIDLIRGAATAQRKRVAA